MYDMLGRFASEDVRDRSVQAMMTRYSVDKKHAKKVVKTCQTLFDQVKHRLGIDEEDAVLLRWAAYLHEIGLAISHSGYHRHSAYLLAHSDVDGFSQVDKIRVSQLVQYHRRKIKSESYEEINMIGGKALVYLCLLLRLAVLLHHSRGKQENPPILLTAHDAKNWTITILPEYEGKNLLLVDLQEEQDAFAKWGVELTVESDVNA